MRIKLEIVKKNIFGCYSLHIGTVRQSGKNAPKKSAPPQKKIEKICALKPDIVINNVQEYTFSGSGDH